MKSRSVKGFNKLSMSRRVSTPIRPLIVLCANVLYRSRSIVSFTLSHSGILQKRFPFQLTPIPRYYLKKYRTLNKAYAGS